MTVYNMTYDPRSDPNALFARGFENMVGGINLGRERSQIGDFAAGIDPYAEAMQITAAALRAGLPAQVAFGLGGLQQRSTQGLGVLPGWWGMATPQQRQGYLDRVGGTNVNVFGSIPGYLEGDTQAETKENVRRYRDKQLEPKEDIPLSNPQIEAYGEAMQTRIDKVDKFRPGGKDFSEEDLFKEWQKYVGMYSFKNDTQRKQILNVWKNKLNNLENELDWNPEEPKWAEAIGLKFSKPPTGLQGRPKNQTAFEEAVRSIKDPDERQKYFDRWKTLWPDEYE